MFGASPQEAFDLPPHEPPREEGDLGEAAEEMRSAKIYPFVKPDEQKKEEVLEKDFRYQDMEVISNGEVVAKFYRGFPTKVIIKENGACEVLEKRSTGIKSHIFEKVDEIKTG